MSLTITDLYLYPIKSCAGLRVDEADLWETGLFLDRFWMAVDAHGAAVTQRTVPRLALVRPQWKFGELRVSAPGMMSISVPVQGFDYDDASRRVRVTVGADTVDAFVEDALVSTWFSDFCGQPLRVVRIDPDARRVCDPARTGGTEALMQFADAFSLRVLSRASLRELDDRLQAAGEAAAGVARFRPNVVVDGVSAHGEDTLRELRGPGYALRLVAPATHDRMVTIDPDTAHDGAQPLALLATYRPGPAPGTATFGMDAIVTEGADEAVLRVGDVLQPAG